MKQKTSVISVAINILLVLGIVIYIALSSLSNTLPSKTTPLLTTQESENISPTPDASEDIRYTITTSSTEDRSTPHTYTSEDLGIAFEYANTLTKPIVRITPSDEERPDIATIVLSDIESKTWWDACEHCYEGGPDQIDITLFRNPEGISLEEWIITNKDTPYIYTNYEPFHPSQQMKTFAINERKIVEYSWIGLGGSDVIMFQNEDNSIIYRVSTYSLSDNLRLKGDLYHLASSILSKI
jgi:hypothetical protein